MEHTDQLLEDFWLELSEGFVDIDKLSPFSCLGLVYGTDCKYFLNMTYYPYLQSLSAAEAGIKEYLFFE